MSAEAAIHATWTADSTLCDLIATDHFSTGWQQPEENYQPEILPFASLSRLGSEVENTSSGEIATVRMRFDVWSEDLSVTKSAANRITELYRKYEANWPKHKILNLTFDDRLEERQPNGLWHAALEADVLIERTF